MTENNESEKTWKETAVAKSRISQNAPVGIDENHQESQSG
jgi:hypothetical protein